MRCWHLTSIFFCYEGFYSVSGSSLSDSSYSVSSEATQGGPAPLTRPQKLWEQIPLSADSSDALWSEGAAQQQSVLQNSQEEPESTDGPPVPGELVHWL